MQLKEEIYFINQIKSKPAAHMTVSLRWYLVPCNCIQIFILLLSFLNLSLLSTFPFFFVHQGEGNEEISNMIHNYIKEIEDLRYLHDMYLNIFY